jgi:hypothetical protein
LNLHGMTRKQPKYIIVYCCQTCGIESGYTELDKPLCRYCDKVTPLTLLSKEKITIEAISKRLSYVADNLTKNLKMGYDSLPEELKKDATEEYDAEKELLKLMAKAKSLQEKTDNLKLKKPKSKKH